MIFIITFKTLPKSPGYCIKKYKTDLRLQARKNIAVEFDIGVKPKSIRPNKLVFCRKTVTIVVSCFGDKKSVTYWNKVRWTIYVKKESLNKYVYETVKYVNKKTFTAYLVDKELLFQDWIQKRIRPVGSGSYIAEIIKK